MSEIDISRFEYLEEQWLFLLLFLNSLLNEGKAYDYKVNWMHAIVKIKRKSKGEGRVRMYAGGKTEWEVSLCSWSCIYET